jgi:hypothetical protein
MEFILKQEPYLLSYQHDLEELSQLLKDHFNYDVKPYVNPSLPEFNNLLPESRRGVAEGISAYLGALKAELATGEYNSERFVLQFLFRMGQAPSTELSNILKNERFIQIYNRDHLQTFRSLACFERCSFTLEQLTSRTWYELWQRDNLFYMAFTGLGVKLLDVVKFTSFKLEFPPHDVVEIDSSQSFKFSYKLKTVCGLTRQNKIQAALLIEDWKF